MIFLTARLRSRVLPVTLQIPISTFCSGAFVVEGTYSSRDLLNQRVSSSIIDAGRRSDLRTSGFHHVGELALIWNSNPNDWNVWKWKEKKMREGAAYRPVAPSGQFLPNQTFCIYTL
eukprot:304612-Pelagomonas_calceolata.AAC.1